MRKAEKFETEGFHNQTLTQDARQRQSKQQPKKKARKVVALQLDEIEHAAFRYLGGVDALKAIICPPDLCIRCRKADREAGTWLDCLCAACNGEHEDASCSV